MADKLRGNIESSEYKHCGTWAYFFYEYFLGQFGSSEGEFYTPPSGDSTED